MSDEIFLEGKNYVSSKKAALTSGYAQDYIGQLARTGAIDAQRVGGLWYVRMESLSGYQRNAASYAPSQPVKTAQDLDSIVSFDGKEYVSAARAAKLTGYNQDYVGQLARGGKILSRQIGNRWYVEKDALEAHKSEKDRLLAAVQAEAVGFKRPEPSPLAPVHAPVTLMNYYPEERDLMPSLPSKVQQAALPAINSRQQIPIRVVPARRAGNQAPLSAPLHRPQQPIRTSGKTISKAAGMGVALTFVLVLSYGLFSLKDHSIYAVGSLKNAVQGSVSQRALPAAVGEIADSLLGKIEVLVVPELVYHRR